MVRKRIPETCEVETDTIGVFSRVAGWTGFGAAWRVRGIMGEGFNAGEMVVDVGTGPATIPLHLQKMFPLACFHGLDVALPMLAEARRHSRRMNTPLPLLCGSGTALPFQDNTLDMVISFFCLHHISEPGIFLSEVDRVLKDNGKFLLIDFKRNIPAVLFGLMIFFWKLAFIFSPGKNGLKESIDSAWTSLEIRESMSGQGLTRFQIHETRTELILTGGIKKFLKELP
jgi:ubiquinone/menaquinone biosynthesis C-methylase UbiE